MNDRRESESLPRLAEAYRRTPTPAPAARARLLARLDREAAPRRGWIWISAPGALGLRASAAVALACLLLAIGYALSFVTPGAHHAGRVAATGTRARVTGPTGGPGEGDLAGAGANRSERVVEFVLVASRATRVSVVGDFNDWDASRTPMRRVDGGGTWIARVPLPEGRRVYAFVVDGDRWVVDPTAPLAPADEFGVARSVVVVSGNGI